MERTDDLVDREALAAHQRHVATLRERLAKAAESLRLEQSVHAVAERNYRNAVEAGSGDRHDLKSALDAAASRLVVESESHDAARAAFDFHVDQTPRVTATAHKGVYEAGIKRRLAASKEADRLKAALAGCSCRICRRQRANARWRAALGCLISMVRWLSARWALAC